MRIIQKLLATLLLGFFFISILHAAGVSKEVYMEKFNQYRMSLVGLHDLMYDPSKMLESKHEHVRRKYESFLTHIENGRYKAVSPDFKAFFEENYRKDLEKIAVEGEVHKIQEDKSSDRRKLIEFCALADVSNVDKKDCIKQVKESFQNAGCQFEEGSLKSEGTSLVTGTFVNCQQCVPYSDPSCLCPVGSTLKNTQNSYFCLEEKLVQLPGGKINFNNAPDNHNK